MIGQVNLVSRDPDAAREFYERLGFTFRAISPPDSGTVAYVSTSRGTGLGIHSVEFAAWWDPDSPGLAAGSAVIDVDLPDLATLDALVEDLRAAGFTVAKEPEDMEFGERYAIVVDPDGHRVGLRTPLR